jgi:cytochrome c-type biogenesis protein CcmE
VASRLSLQGVASVRSKLAVAAVLLVGAFSYLAYAGMQKGWVYLVSVEQYVAHPQFANQRVRLHGKVAADGFESSSAGLSAKFNLTGGGKTLAVVYRGGIPDMFQAGREVVVEGKRDSAGVFRADVLMTKCASKYEPGSPHAKAEKKS